MSCKLSRSWHNMFILWTRHSCNLYLIHTPLNCTLISGVSRFSWHRFCRVSWKVSREYHKNNVKVMNMAMVEKVTSNLIPVCSLRPRRTTAASWIGPRPPIAAFLSSNSTSTRASANFRALSTRSRWMNSSWTAILVRTRLRIDVKEGAHDYNWLKTRGTRLNKNC